MNKPNSTITDSIHIEVDYTGDICDECMKPPTDVIYYAWFNGPDQDVTALCAECAADLLPGVPLPVMIGALSEGDTGIIAEGHQYAGRRFRIRHIGSTGRTVWVDWTEHGSNGYVRATTLITR